MSTTINTAGEKIVITRAFKSGQHLIKINGNVIIEGKLDRDETKTFSHGGRDYALYVNANRKTYHLTVRKGDKVLHESLHDHLGQPVRDEAHAETNRHIQICSLVFAIIGVVVMLTLNSTTNGAVPGGAIGGAIGGGVGGLLGSILGTLVARASKQ